MSAILTAATVFGVAGTARAEEAAPEWSPRARFFLDGEVVPFGRRDYDPTEDACAGTVPGTCFPVSRYPDDQYFTGGARLGATYGLGRVFALGAAARWVAGPAPESVQIFDGTLLAAWVIRFGSGRVEADVRVAAGPSGYGGSTMGGFGAALGVQGGIVGWLNHHFGLSFHAGIDGHFFGNAGSSSSYFLSSMNQITLSAGIVAGP